MGSRINDLFNNDTILLWRKPTQWQGLAKTDPSRSHSGCPVLTVGGPARRLAGRECAVQSPGLLASHRWQGNQRSQQSHLSVAWNCCFDSHTLSLVGNRSFLIYPCLPSYLDVCQQRRVLWAPVPCICFHGNTPPSEWQPVYHDFFKNGTLFQRVKLPLWVV